jgi:hypothetical protein
VLSVVDPTADTLGVLSAHGWSGTEALQFTAKATVGVTSPALPSGLSASTVYYPLPITNSDSLFKVSTTVGGSAVNFTDAGAGEISVTEQRGAMIQAFLDMHSALVDNALIDYATPIPAPFPAILTWVVCKRAAYDIAIVQSLVTDYYFKSAGESIIANDKIAREQIDEWKAGKILPTIGDDATPGIVENGAESFFVRGPWDKWMGGVC